MSDWQRRVVRAEELATRHVFAGEILGFFRELTRFQGQLYGELMEAGPVENFGSNPFEQELDRELERRLDPRFELFIAVVEKSAPKKLRDVAKRLREDGRGSRFELLNSFWEGNGAGKSDETDEFFARAFLQPYAVAVRERANMKWKGPTAYVCPFCKRKPGVGVLRPLGDGGQRSLICSFCLGEWEFRRILCPGCGEGDPAKLPVYTAEELQHVRVEACDTCKSYIKTADMTKSALGDPVVDEIASVPLDLWAQGQGYAKIQTNLMQL